MEVECKDWKHQGTYLRHIMVAFSAVAFVLQLWAYFPVVYDDAYISFRYAYNLVNSGVWNWNADRDYVEAYTNFSFAPLAIVPTALGHDPLVFLKLVSVASVVVVVWLVLTEVTSSLLFCVALLLTAFNPYLYINALSGLETAAFMCLIFGAARFLLKDGSGGKREIGFLVILLLLPLTRPEGALYSAVAIMLHFLRSGGQIQYRKVLFAILTLGCAYMAWRISLFGEILPNTFYVKAVKGFELRNVVFFVLSIRMYLVTIVLLNLVVQNRIYVVFSAVSVALALVVYSPSDLNTTMADRFPLPIFLPLFLLALPLVRGSHRIATASVLLLFWAGLFSDYFQFIRFSPQAQFYKQLGKELSRFSEKKYSLLIGEAGIIPYFSRWKSYDFIGLANNEVSHEPLSSGYLARISPDLIFLYSSTLREEGISRGFYDQGKIVDYMKETERYEFVGPFNACGFYLMVYLRSSGDDRGKLRQVLEDNIRRTNSYGAFSVRNKRMLWDWFSFRFARI